MLVGGTSLAKLLSDPSWDSNQDQSLAEFQVVGKAATLGNALDLGEVGSTIRTVSGALDPQGQSVALYKITLGTSQPLWQLSLQINAQRFGSPLRSALTLFDQQGHALASRTAGDGLGTLIDDPYLFKALTPGVYYVGVSGAGNIGGQPGGYDPTTGAPGKSSGISVFGPFQLEVVADPIPSPTQVVGFSVEAAAPTSTSPTGFSISFSNPIAPDSLKGDPLFVQDQQGRQFPVMLGSVGSGLNQFEFWFNHPLAPGRYSLVIPQGGGLTDLIGRTPIAPNAPAGTLATWVVHATPTGGGDVGIPTGFKRVSDTVMTASGTAVLASGGDLTYRIFIPANSSATLNTDASAVSLQIQLKRTDGTVSAGSGLGGSVVGADPSAKPMLGRYFANLDGGVYLLTLSGSGSNALTVSWSFTIQLNRDAQVANAVGAAGAIGLRLGGSGSPDASVGLVGSFSAAPFSDVPGPSAISPLPSSYTVTVGSTLVGKPSGGNDGFTAGGATVSGGLLALADTGRGLVAGALAAGGYGDDGHLRDAEGLLMTNAATETDVPHSRPEALADDLQRADGQERGVEADASALLEADRLAEAARAVGGWLFGVEGQRAAIANDDGLDHVKVVSAEASPPEDQGTSQADLEHSGKVERATLGAPVSLVVAAAAAFRFRQLARKWWRRPVAKSAASKATQPPLWRGPRYMVPPSRRMNRARNAHHV